jgi:3-phenylpropionate/trans-cinnamate dioxygenase ferredoxin reductase component
VIPDHVLIVGAGLAGSRCAQTLRAEGFDGKLSLIGDELHPPYERPALSKTYLAGTRSEIALQPASYWRDNDIDLLLGTRVDQVAATRKVVRTTRGDIAWDALVIATGARPRRLPNLAGPDVHLLRTRADADRLRPELRPGRRLLIVGAGLVGTEVASTARQLELDVTLVDDGRFPLERVLGPEIGRVLADRYRLHGVDLHPRSRVARLHRDHAGALRAVTLDSGTRVACDLLLVAVGAEPAGDLLDGRTATDEAGRTGIPDVYACGDLAARWSPALNRNLRLEHWSSAADQAATVARTILGHEQKPTAVPYFWSDQFGARIQHMGFATDWTRVTLAGDESSLEARYLDADDRLVAALLIDNPHALARLRRQLAAEPIAA